MREMKTLELCIDTSSGAGVAVVVDGKTRGRAHSDDPRGHTENLAVLIQQATAAAGLDPTLANNPWTRVNVGTGPAPFTGLRSGLVTAVTFAEVWGVPVYGVPSLEIIGRQNLDLLPPGSEVVAAADARRQEVYWAAYTADGPDGVTVEQEPQVGAPTTLAAHLHQHPALVVGPGAPLVRKEIDVPVGALTVADPAVLSRVVNAALAANPDAALPVQPLYLRRPDIHGAAAARQ